MSHGTNRGIKRGTIEFLKAIRKRSWRVVGDGARSSSYFTTTTNTGSRAKTLILTLRQQLFLTDTFRIWSSYGNLKHKLGASSKTGTAF